MAVQKKRTTKKAAKKKVAEKKVAAAQTAPASGDTSSVQLPPNMIRPKGYSFNILSDDRDVTEGMSAVLASMVSRRKNQTINFNRMIDVRQYMMPLDSFYMQWALGIYGIPEGSLLEIIGAEGLGKTTLVFKILGGAMAAGCPALYVEAEGKQLPAHRVMRALHTNPTVAVKMLQRLRRDRANSLEHMAQIIEDYVAAARGRVTLKDADSVVPIDTPLVIAVDPWSKLMNPDEAAGFYEYGDNMSAAKKARFKKTGQGSNLGHAKWAHAWTRRLSYMMQHDNVILVLVHHQNDDIDMSGGGFGGFVLPESYKNLNNKTHLGGRAFNQTAAVQLILADGGGVKGSDRKTLVGKKVNVNVAKNSFGPDKRKFSYIINTHTDSDTPAYLTPALSFDETTAKWMAEEKLIGTRVNGELYSCDSLDISGADAEYFMATFNSNETVKINLGGMLGIEGYVDTVERVISDIEEEQRQQEAETEAATSTTPNSSEVSDEDCDKDSYQDESAEAALEEDLAYLDYKFDEPV